MTDTTSTTPIPTSTAIQLAGVVLEFAIELLSANITNATAQTAITILQQWLPYIIAEAQQLLPQVQALIGILRGSTVLTADQVATIDALNKASDDAFEAAAAANGV